jgi:hypothetical protein
MAGQNKGPAGAAADADGIPMQKTNPMIFIGIGGAVVLLGGALLWASSGSDETEKKAAEIKAAANAEAPAGMTPKEQAEHLKRTQLALQKLEASAAEKKKAADEAAAAEAERAAAAAPAAQPASGSGDNSGSAAPKPAKPASKKDLDGLDSIGSDISKGLQ